MMKMNITHNRFALLLTFTAIILFGFVGCKSPIDLDDSVIEVPIPTNPIDRRDARFELFGNIKSSRNSPNGPMDFNDFKFKMYEVEDFYIDTTDSKTLKIALKVETETDSPDRSQFEEVIPYHFEFELDTVQIPVFDNPPGPRERLFIQMKEAEMKLFVFAKKKDAGGVKIVRSDKTIDFMDEDGDISLKSYVYAIRSNGPGKKTTTEIIIEHIFLIQGVEIDSYDRKIPTSSNGRSIFKIRF